MGQTRPRDPDRRYGNGALGQKRRVLLARSPYKRPRILFLDEATSHLDVARERLVNEAIRQFKPTRVIIAHQPETIAAADRAIDLAQENSVAMVT